LAQPTWRGIDLFPPHLQAAYFVLCDHRSPHLAALLARVDFVDQIPLSLWRWATGLMVRLVVQLAPGQRRFE
jgi:hypothetical protein